MPSPGRNDPCPCGSGKKFKQCCESKKNRMSPALIALLIAGVVLAVVITVSNARQSSTGGGRVWSAEHGHYHDASGREVPR
jgi:hypothetical protein